MTRRSLSGDGFVPAAFSDLQALKTTSECKRYFEMFLNAIADGISILDRDLTIIKVNHVMEDAYPHARPLTGKKCFFAYHGRLEPCETCPSRKAIESGTAQSEMVPYKGFQGELLGWLEVYSYPIKDERDEVVGVIEQVRDITERKQVEDALAKNEERLRLCTETAHLGTYDWDVVHDRHIWSPETYEIFGLSPDTTLSIDLIKQLIFPEDRRDDIIAAELDPATSQGGYTLEDRIVSAADGQVRWIHTKASIIFSGEGSERRAIRVLGVVQDITARKLAEIRLRESEEKFRVLAETTPSMIMVYRGEDIVYVNRVAEQLTGYATAELLSKRFWVWVHPEYQSLVRERGLARQRGEQVPSEYEIKALTLDGQIRWLQVNASQIEYLGKPSGIASFIDITERKQADKALLESEGMLARSQEMTSVGSWVWYVKTDEVVISTEMQCLCGLAPNEPMPNGYELFDLTVPEDKERIKLLITSCYLLAEPFNATYRIRRKDGAVRLLECWGEPAKDDTGNVIAINGTVQDITERRQAEAALADAKAQAELYLDLMGHDINNLNQIALGYLELARETPQDAVRQEYLDRSVEILQKSSLLIKNVRKLQALREKAFHPSAVDVCKVLADLHGAYQALPAKAVTLNLNGRDHCYVVANELLFDIFANLVNNAIKHTGDHSSIVLDLDVLTDTGSNYCRVIVEDNGPGIPDEDKERIFHRLSRGATKAKGMGLGLYLVKALVESFSGRVWVEDRVVGDYRKGTRFVVLLPALDRGTG